MPDDMDTCKNCQELTFFISECFHCKANICRKCYRNKHGDNCYHNPYKQKIIQIEKEEKEKIKWRELTEDEIKEYKRNKVTQRAYSEKRIEGDKLDIEKYYRWIKRDQELQKRIPKRIVSRKKAIAKKRKSLKELKERLEYQSREIDFKKLKINTEDYYVQYKE